MFKLYLSLQNWAMCWVSHFFFAKQLLTCAKERKVLLACCPFTYRNFSDLTLRSDSYAQIKNLDKLDSGMTVRGSLQTIRNCNSCNKNNLQGNNANLLVKSHQVLLTLRMFNTREKNLCEIVKRHTLLVQFKQTNKQPTNTITNLFVHVD